MRAFGLRGAFGAPGAQSKPLQGGSRIAGPIEGQKKGLGFRV